MSVYFSDDQVTLYLGVNREYLDLSLKTRLTQSAFDFEEEGA